MRHEALEPKEAARFLTKTPNAVFIDCRSEMEYLFVGHPVGAHHVPWNDGPDWEVNPHFVGQVKKVASVNRPIVLICRSGNRSLDAGDALEKAGFTDVYNVLHGFEGPLDETHHRGTLSGWRHEGLPWEQFCSALRVKARATCTPRPAAGCRSTARRREIRARIEPPRVGHPVERVELQLAIADRARVGDQRLGEPAPQPSPRCAAARRVA